MGGDWSLMRTGDAKRKHAEYMRKWRADHPEHRDYQRAYMAEYLSSPERQEAARSRARQWYLENPERGKQNARKSYASDPEQHQRYNREWIARNRDKWRLYQHSYQARRRARKMSVAVGHVDYEALLKLANGICALCNKPLEGRWHFDHIIPLVRGGEHSQRNLQVTHPRCNQRKNAKLDWTPEE